MFAPERPMNENVKVVKITPLIIAIKKRNVEAEQYIVCEQKSNILFNLRLNSIPVLSKRFSALLFL